MPEKAKIDDLTNGLIVYVKTNVALFKLEAIEFSSIFGSSIISSLFIGLSLFFFLLFISISAGFFLAKYFNENYIGFLLVTAFYFLLTILLILGRKKFIEKPIQDRIIKGILKK